MGIRHLPVWRCDPAGRQRPGGGVERCDPPSPDKARKPLARSEIEAFAKALESYGGYRTTVIALKLMLLTFVRTMELRTAPWSEIEFERSEWRIPGPRMKKRQPHIVPLSRQGLTLLRELHTYTGGRSYLFPNCRNPKACMTATTLNRALERWDPMGKKHRFLGACSGRLPRRS